MIDNPGEANLQKGGESICGPCHANKLNHGGAISGNASASSGKVAGCLYWHEPHANGIGNNVRMVRRNLNGATVNYLTDKVDYFRADGAPLPAEGVSLNVHGERQADAAGALFAHSQVRFDRVVTSGLPRTVQTAERVLAACGQALEPLHDAALQEIRGGRLADIPRDALEAAFLGAFQSGPDIERQRFLGGESVCELLDRSLPAFDRWRMRDDWDCLLLVLHGGVNRAILSTLLTARSWRQGKYSQSKQKYGA